MQVIRRAPSAIAAASFANIGTIFVRLEVKACGV
jgi:hypothetical protein